MTDPPDFDPTRLDRIVIVGAGACGSATAEALRDGGYSGSLVLVGAEDHEPYERPPLSKESLTSQAMPSPIPMLTREQANTLEIDFMSGVAGAHIDRDRRMVILDDGRALDYDRLVLATGASARPLLVAGGEHGLLIRSYDDAISLRARLVPGARVGIVGAGFIGLEIAARRSSEVATSSFWSLPHAHWRAASRATSRTS